MASKDNRRKTPGRVNSRLGRYFSLIQAFIITSEVDRSWARPLVNNAPLIYFLITMS